MKRQLSMLLAATTAATAFTAFSFHAGAETDGSTVEVTYNYDGENHTRRMEKLSRGLTAVKVNNGVFLSWRLLGTEASVQDILSAPDFVVYKNGSKLAEIEDSTNYLDPAGSISDTYTVAPAVPDAEQCAPVKVMANNYFDIPLVKPENETITYTDPDTGETSTIYESLSFFPADCSCGDLDGDGEYEIIVKWTSSEHDVGSPGSPAYSGTVRFAAYKLDGTKMWDQDINLGRNVYSSAHTAQFLVYDFDGDGKAEMTVQTSLGSTDAKGNYTSKAAAEDSYIHNFTDEDNANTDYRGTYGLFAEGEEFLTVFNGETGAAVDTIKYPVDRYNTICWGTDSGGRDGGVNRSNRFVADVAYLDGVNPYAVYWRGYYNATNGRTGVFGVRFDGERLHCDYIFDTLKGQPGYTDGNEKYAGNGNHNLTVADVDDDGRDEVISGAMCLEADENNNFNPRWCTFMEHGDALHIGDYDPTHKGLEFFTIHEDSGPNYMSGEMVEINYGMSVIDADTGEILFHRNGSDDTGRGVMANVGAGGYYQIWSSKTNLFYANGGTSFTDMGASWGYQNFRVFWDADLYDELLDGTGVYSWSGSRFDSVFNAGDYGCVKINGTKANPGLQADLFGDWREELVYPTSDGEALRVFTTTALTNYKLPTLMHDPVYRSGVAAEQSCYNQPPHIGFYLADEIFKPAVTELEITKQPDKTVYNIGEALDTAGLEVTAYFSDGTAEKVEGYVISGYNADSAGNQTLTVAYGGKTAEFTVRIDAGFEIDEEGYITAATREREAAVIPSAIDGIPVIGIRSGALKDAVLTELTIINEPFTIEADALPEGIMLRCYIGSAVYVYAVEQGITVETIDTRSFTANITYSEDAYNNWSIMQDRQARTELVYSITYGVGGRSNGGGDGETGFRQAELNGETVLYAGAGQYANANRHAYFTLQDMPALSNEIDSVFETDFYIPAGSENIGMYVFDDSSAYYSTNRWNPGLTAPVIDSVKLSETIQADTWYTYKIIYHKGSYYRAVSERGSEAAVEYTRLDAVPSDSGIVKFMFLPDNNGQYSGQLMYLDNTQAYTNVEFSNITLNITDESGTPIARPAVALKGGQYTGSADGIFSRELTSGMYEVTISAEGYESKTISLAAFKNSVTKNIILSKEYIPVTGVAFAEKTVSVMEGGTAKVTASVLPANASEQEVNYTSSDEQIVTVDEDGTIRGIAAGTAAVTASAGADGELRDTCEVTVYAGGYEQIVTTVKITGGEETGYVPKSGSNVLKPFTAECYDQNGIKMDGVQCSWSSDNDKVTVSGGVVTIYPGAAGQAVLSAEADGKRAEKLLTLKDTASATAVFAKEDYEQSDIDVWIADPAMTQTENDITYGCGSRSSDGQSTYIRSTEKNGRKYIEATAGKFWTANRNAYITFNNAPSSYAADYVFETDLMLHTGAYPINVVLKGGGITVTSLNLESLGIDADTWYHYQLIISDGKYIQTILDADGDVVSCGEITAEKVYPINRIDFLGYNTTENVSGGASAGLDNLSCYSCENAMGSVSVRVVDKNGAALSGAAVKIGSIEAETDSIGIARFTLPNGIYKARAYNGGEEIGSVQFALTEDSVMAVITEGEQIITPPTPTPIPLPTPTPTPTPIATAVPYGSVTIDRMTNYRPNTGAVNIICNNTAEDTVTADLIIAYYDADGILAAVDMEKTDFISGQSVISREMTDKTFSKCMIYIWDMDKAYPIAEAIAARKILPGGEDEEETIE